MRNLRITLGLIGTTALLVSVSAPAHATYEGQVGRIAFGAFDTANRGQADIYSVRPDGHALHQLTDAPGLDICPAYSADGKQIAFCSNRTGAFEIWVMNANGKQERQVTSLGTFAIFPDFAPDGTLLVFAAAPVGGGNPELFTVPVDGGAPSRLTDTAFSEHDPVWSPDGTRVLFRRVAADGSTSQLWVIDVNSGAEKQLTFDPTFKDQTPDWSPDGATIAYNAAGDIWVMNADGSGQTNLTQTSYVEFGTAFSPDGSHIAFTGTGGPVPAGERYVQTIRADGSDRQVVAPTPGLLQAVPAWQPLGGGR